jgi:transcriptional regulator with XRE-family HTH domain
MSLAATLRAARLARELSASALAERSGVSHAMIGKIERGEVQPTAALLGRLSGALRMRLSELVARAEGDDRRLVRVADQPAWIDPASGYRRRAVSPVSGAPMELVEVELPAGAEVSYPTDALPPSTNKFGCSKVVCGSARATRNTSSTRGTVSSSAARRRARSSTRPARLAATSSRSPSASPDGDRVNPRRLVRATP